MGQIERTKYTSLICFNCFGAINEHSGTARHWHQALALQWFRAEQNWIWFSLCRPVRQAQSSFCLSNAVYDKTDFNVANKSSDLTVPGVI